MSEKLNISLALILAIFLVAYFYWIYTPGTELVSGEISDSPEIYWGDLGKRMLGSGVIDAPEFEAIHSERGSLTEDDKTLLYGERGKLKITRENSSFVLNLLWALGLGNKNSILEKGEMVRNGLGDASRFASTGGWTLAKGDAMDHYSKHEFIILTATQQELVERVSGNIYRPCCGNSTHFPDCNHGMAMLGLLELAAFQGKTESELYSLALAANSLWFPVEYEHISKYFEMKKIDKDARTMLSADYSSSRGYAKVYAFVKPQPEEGGASCGI